MTSPHDIAALRDRVLVHATELYCAGRDRDHESIIDELAERIVDDLSLPALLDRLERAERDRDDALAAASGNTATTEGGR